MKKILILAVTAILLISFAACRKAEKEKATIAAAPPAEEEINTNLVPSDAAAVNQSSKIEAESASQPALSTPVPEESVNYLFNTRELYTYQDMEADLTTLNSVYPELMQLQSIAVTADGRNLYLVTVGSADSPKSLMINAGIHAREYITSQLCMMQLHDLLQKAKEHESYQGIEVAELLSTTRVYFAPMVNPDGVSISQLGMNGIQKPENKQKVQSIYSLESQKAADMGAYLQQWKSNSQGVDLNRNFDADWESYNDKVGHPSADHYKGSAAEAEIESRALADLTRRLKFTETVSYHTQGEVIYWYYKQEGELKARSRHIAEIVQSLTGYRLDSNYQNLDPAGYKDWAISKMKIPSLTIECGHGANPVDPAQLSSIWQENKSICPALLLDLYQVN